MMPLKTKPDVEEAVLRWKYFWNGELFQRPVVLAKMPKPGSREPDEPKANCSRYLNALTGRWDEQARMFDESIERTIFPGEMIPMVSPDFGPGQWAAFFGAELQFSSEAPATNWVEPIIGAWEDFLPLELNMENYTLQKLLRYINFLAEAGEGKFLVSQIDAHSNADALSALRGVGQFMTDLYDKPGVIEKAMESMMASYIPVHDVIETAGKMKGGRGQGHYGIWHENSFQVVQSDVICMMGPDHLKRFVLPALHYEFSCHEGIYFHLDGPGALKHLNDILDIPGRWILQWQPGYGQKPNWQWTEILQKAQKAGKAVHVFGDGLGFDQVKALNSVLDPAGTIYSPCLEKESEAMALFRWLIINC